MIEITGLNKHFGELAVLKDINLHVNEGETIAIIGPSGSGKSTLIRCLNLLERPTTGQIRIDDITMTAPHFLKKDIHQLRLNVGMVFQSFNLFPHLNALDNVAQGLITVQKKQKQLAYQEAYAYLERVGLADKTTNYPAQLSGGQQQRVAIARCLAMQPKVILMDEPTSALDPELVQEVLAVIKDITREQVTSIIVTHELSFAKEVSDRVIFMADGCIIEYAPSDEIFTHPKQKRTQLFLEKFIGSTDFSI